ncbi:MAG: hypothetical protein ACP6IY_18260 [Promethearchaeia archaeon]
MSYNHFALMNICQHFLNTFETKSNLKCGGGERQKTQDMTLRTFLGYFFIPK